MKRRQFLGLAPAIAGVLMARRSMAQQRPCPPGQISVTGGSSVATSCSGDQLDDWLLRSKGPGVKWAHNFEEDWEVDQFDNNALSKSVESTFSTEGHWIIEIYSNGLQRIADDGFAGGGCLESGPTVEYTTTTSSPLPSENVAGYVASGALLTVAALPEPGLPPLPWGVSGRRVFFALYNPTTGAAEVLEATGITGTTFTVNRAANSSNTGLTNALAWPAGSQVRWPVHSRTAWRRPLSPLKYVDNELAGKQDWGWVASKPLYSRTNANGGRNSAIWRWGNYAHADYGAYSNSEPLTPLNCVTTFPPDSSFPTWDRKDGTEFWIQARVKISANRFKRWQTTTGQKWMWLLGETGSYATQECILTADYTGRVSFYNFADRNWNYPQGSPPTRTDYDPPYGSLERNYNGQDLPLPPDTWCTLLYHMKPGHISADRNVAVLVSPLSASTSDTTLRLSAGHGMPAINGSGDPETGRRSYFATLVGANGTEVVRVTGQPSADTFTVTRGGTPRSFSVGESVRITAAQALVAFRKDYPNDSLIEVKINRPGIDPPGQYITLVRHPYLALKGDNVVPFGWSLFQMSAYANNHYSFLPWSFRMTQVILSTREIPCPQT